MADVQRLGIVGAGFMGSGIAETAARVSVDVRVFEFDASQRVRSRDRVSSSVERAISRGKLPEDQGCELLSRIAWVDDLDGLADCELIVEAVVENVDVKEQVFSDLDRLAQPQALLASNTSSIPIAQLAAATSRPEQVLGLHFFSPVPVMDLVEIVVAVRTSAAAVDSARRFVASLGKHSVETKDRAGFVVNRLLIPYIVSALRMYQDGVATREDIDDGMRRGCGHPMGPLTLADFIGLDVVHAVCDSLYDEYKNPDFAAPPLLKRMVTAGMLGRKSGAGIYDYPTPDSAVLARS